MTLDQLLRLGFDSSAHTFGRPNLLSVSCSQCQSAVINGVPCHETGCPHQTGTCQGCGDITERRRIRMCESCANPEPFDDTDDNDDQ